MLKEIESIHNQAMDLIEQAQVLRFKGERDKSNSIMLEAFEKEKAAADSLKLQDIEPSRSILYRSAASIAYELGMNIEAERLLCQGLAGNPPVWVANELRDLYENVTQSRHLEVHGVHLSDEEFQMSFAGGLTGYGISPLEEFTERVDAVRRIMQRTAQRKMYKGEYRIKIPKEIRTKFPTFVSVPRAASFAITFKIAIPDEQLKVFEELPKGELISEVMDCIELYEKNELKKLEEKISSDQYFSNFSGLIDKVLPDGENVSLVGFTYNKDNEEKAVSLRKTREKLEITNIKEQDSPNILLGLNTGDEVVLKGILQVADRSIDVPLIKINSNGILYRVLVPEGQIDDVVRPLWDKSVIIKGTKQHKKTIQMDKIQESED